MTEIEILPKDQKKVIAKTLFDLNHSATEIASLLNIDRTTVYRYSKEPTSEELQQFATEYKTIVSMKQHQILAKVLKRLDLMADRSLDFKGMIKLFEVMKKYTTSIYDIHKNSESEKRWARFER